MKKNILTLMFVVAFVCGGLLVSEVKAFTGFSKVTQTSSGKASKSVKNSGFDRKYAELKAFCKENRGPRCDAAITAYGIVSDSMWENCLDDMDNCDAYQNIALRALDNAMLICRAEEPLIANFQKTELNQLQGLLAERRQLLK